MKKKRKKLSSINSIIVELKVTRQRAYCNGIVIIKRVGSLIIHWRSIRLKGRLGSLSSIMTW